MKRSLRNLLLWCQVSGAGGLLEPAIEYLLRESFSADDATPVAVSRAASPGPGNMTFADTANKAAIAAGLWYANGANAAGDPKILDSGAPYTNHAGMYWFARCIFPDINTVAGTWLIVLKNVATDGNLNSQIGLRTNFNLLFAQIGAGSADTKRVHAENEELDVLALSHGTGGSLWIRGVGESRWLRIWTDSVVANTNAYPQITPTAANAKQVKVSELARGQLAAPYLVVTDTAAVNVATTTNGQSVSAPDADCRIGHTITAATGVTQEILVRASDSDNGYVIRCDQAGSVITLHKREAGVTGAVLATTAQTWTNATQYRVNVAVDGPIISTWVDNVAKSQITDALFNRTQTGIIVSHAGADLRAYALRQAITGTPPKRTISGGVLLGIGDSKTRGQDDDTSPYPLGKNGFMQRLAADLNSDTGNEWIEIIRLGTGGITVVQRAADIDLGIANQFGYPTHILVNLGANDSVAGTIQADYQTSMAYILDACHARWPIAKIYVSTPWRDTGGTYWDDVHTSIGTVLSTRSSWAFRGVDERATLEGGDDGVTYYSDGVHPNAAGHQLYAETLQAIMGY